MRITTLKNSTLILACLFTGSFYGQQKPVKQSKQFGKIAPAEVMRCATTEYEELLQQQFPARRTTAQFEEWLAPKVNAAKNQRLAALNSPPTTNTVVTIPVVVHVIHNGDAVGVDENISEGQILSQITILNQDFRRMAGTPGYNSNPVGADTEIQFCLAQRDPNGLFSTGIVRHNIAHEGNWEMNDINENLKPQTQWDPTQYLNLWVVSGAYIGIFGIELELAGYAQFPSESGLEGLEQQAPANQDGVVLGHRYFGSSDIYPEGTYNAPRDKGRTASHEVGHFFGLRHIWGDGNNCNATDYCADTPAAAAANQGCPVGLDSCPTNPGDDMIENYMDYTDDECQNIFTLNQKDRMMAVMQNSPRRASLATSQGCIPGMVYDNDGSLNIMDLRLSCGNSLSPKLQLLNSGNNAINSVAISYSIQGGTTGTFNWVGSLAQGEETEIELPLLTAESGDYIFNVVIITVNGIADETSLNDNKSMPFTIAPAANYDTDQITITIQTDYFGSETTWSLKDSNGAVVSSGGPYEDAMSPDDIFTFTETIDVEDNQCYTFTINDSYGDGICCDGGNGFYTITTAENATIKEGGEFNSVDKVRFGINFSLGNNNIGNILNGLKLYPNPSSTTVSLISTASMMPETYTVYNSLGQVIAAASINSQTTVIDVASYSNGIYFIKVNGGQYSKTLQFVKN